MREEAFDALAEEAQRCRACPAMAGRTAVLSRLNGCLTPRILFVAEAPGRRGGDRTRVPMSGDASGRVFRHLLSVAGFRPEEVFITNAALCNPRSESGANRPPTSAEVRNCLPFLQRTIAVLDPPFVVAIGARALAALDQVERHGLALSRDAGRAVSWHGRQLIPLYHPSPQVLISRRSLQQQEEDWRVMARLIEDYSTGGRSESSARPK